MNAIYQNYPEGHQQMLPISSGIKEIIETMIVVRLPNTAFYCRTLPSVNVTPAVDLFWKWYAFHDVDMIAAQFYMRSDMPTREKNFAFFVFCVIELLFFFLICFAAIVLIVNIMNYPFLLIGFVLATFMSLAEWTQLTSIERYAVHVVMCWLVMGIHNALAKK